MHCQTSTSRWLNLSSLVTYLQLILMLVYDSLTLTVSGVSSGQLWGHSSGERKLRVLHCSSWTVLNARCTGCTVLLKDKVVNRTFVEIVRYPSNIAQWPSLLCLISTTPIFTARHNARIASAVLAIAIPSVGLSVCHMPVLCQNDCT